MSEVTVELEETAFSDREQHSEANHLGMWAFLATEILFFGGLFASYAVLRWTYPQAFAQASDRLEFPIGTLNTAVLLTSSLFMALADLAVKRNDRKWVRNHLVITWVLGALFIGIKLYEYYQKYVEHLIPGPAFHFPEAPPQAQLFFFLYFAMTGLHAVHMLFGLAPILWSIRRNSRGTITADRPDSISLVGLYWHFVDCIWVFLYPLLYLAGK